MRDQTNKNEYKKMVEMFNRNMKHINRELSLAEYTELVNKYNACDRGHLCKILTCRGIKLYV